MYSMDALCQNYLEFCRYQKNLNDKSLKAYKIDLTQFSCFLAENGGELNKQHISNYISYLYKKYRPKTIKRKIASLKAFCNFLEFDELIDKNPFTKMKIRFKEPSLLPKTISLSIIQAVLTAAYEELPTIHKTKYSHSSILRDIAVLELLFATGVRVSELCSLTVSDVNMAEGFIKIYGKGSRERIVQIGNEDVLLALKNYKAAFSITDNTAGFFFINRLKNRLSEQSVRYMINKYTSKSGMPVHITPHMYRHSLATLLLEEDVDIRYIQRILGHSSIVTTQIYTHVTSNKQKSILITKHPRNKVVLNKG
ncbi:tyrosine recombinase XerC [Ruminiclostridium hungatei]|uniref:Tyrosine recombinase XerC n=1 Tax=Ruminiclostridium hungatei TaxID=48256 RepID=A0A1V4SR87_RUMHU|nr:tyrosine-type recombinase/integrase [Ruminiclostridium hungatei]OPX45966.1 tyrosine recombinase XerC [Ruminiclostridium hungatei]